MPKLKFTRSLRTNIAAMRALLKTITLLLCAKHAVLPAYIVQFFSLMA